MKIEIEIRKNKMTIEFKTIGSGQNPKLFSFVNGKKYISHNPFNFKKDPTDDIQMVVEELRFGAYKFFV